MLRVSATRLLRLKASGSARDPSDQKRARPRLPKPQPVVVRTRRTTRRTPRIKLTSLRKSHLPDASAARAIGEPGINSLRHFSRPSWRSQSPRLSLRTMADLSLLAAEDLASHLTWLRVLRSLQPSSSLRRSARRLTRSPRLMTKSKRSQLKRVVVAVVNVATDPIPRSTRRRILPSLRSRVSLTRSHQVKEVPAKRMTASMMTPDRRVIKSTPGTTMMKRTAESSSRVARPVAVRMVFR